jgi:hypothetical protein
VLVQSDMLDAFYLFASIPVSDASGERNRATGAQHIRKDR